MNSGVRSARQDHLCTVAGAKIEPQASESSTATRASKRRERPRKHKNGVYGAREGVLDAHGSRGVAPGPLGGVGAEEIDFSIAKCERVGDQVCCPSQIFASTVAPCFGVSPSSDTKLGVSRTPLLWADRNMVVPASLVSWVAREAGREGPLSPPFPSQDRPRAVACRIGPPPLEVIIEIRRTTSGPAGTMMLVVRAVVVILTLAPITAGWFVILLSERARSYHVSWWPVFRVTGARHPG